MNHLPDPKPNDDVARAIDRLEVTVTGLSAIISLLVTRLQPVLRTSTDPATPSLASGHIGACPISRDIYAQITRINEASDTLNELLTHLEI